MNTITIFKKAMALAMMLTLATSAFALGGTVTYVNADSPVGNIILTGNLTIDIPSGNTVTVSGIISGSYELTKTGSGILVLTGANTHSGDTKVSAGELYVGYNTTTGNLGTGNLNIAAGATVRFLRSNDYTYNGVISGAGNISSGYAGTTILTGINTYTGTTYVSNGVLQIDGSINNTSGTSGTGIQVLAGATLRLCRAESNFNRLIWGGGNVEIWAGVTFTNAMTYTGTTTLGVTGGRWGDLYLANGGSLNTASNVIINNSTATSVLYFDWTADATFSNKISGAAGNARIIKNKTNKVTLTGESDYTGAVYVSSGTLQIGNGSTGSIKCSTLNLSTTTTKLIFNPGAATTFSGVISGSGAVEFNPNSSGTKVYLTGNNTYTGLTTITQGDIYIGNGGTTGAIAGNILNNRYLNFSRSDTYTYSGAISGTGSVYLESCGTIILTGNNSYTGNTHIGSVGTGILQIGDGTNGSIDKTGTINVYGGSTLRLRNTHANFNRLIQGAGNVEIQATVYYTTDMTYTGTTTIGTTANYGQLWLAGNTATGSGLGTGNVIVNNGFIVFQRANNFNFPNIISGTGNIAKYMGNKVTLTGANTLTGVTQINDGTLQVGNGTSGSIANTAYVHLTAAAAILRFEPSSENMVFAPKITGPGKVELGNGYGLYITSNDNDWTGGTSVLTSGGVLIIGATVSGSGGVTGTGTTGIVPGTVNLAAGTRFCFYRSNDFTFSGKISGAGSIEKYGVGTVTLTGANDFTGSVTVINGTLKVGNGSSGTISASSSASIGNGATLRFVGTHTYANNISGAGNLVLQSGVLYLTANNTFTGNTTVESGSFYIGYGTASGDILGNIVNNGYVNFGRNNAYTYNGIISGTGEVWPGWGGSNATVVTFTKAQQYTGRTYISSGAKLVLGIADCIKSSSYVSFRDDFGKLDISANNTIRQLNATSSQTNCDVILNSKILTIGTGAADANGGGSYYGKITGGVGSELVKTGTQSLYLCGASNNYEKTTIKRGYVYVGNNTATGSISNIVAFDNATGNKFDAQLFFNKTGNYTYSGAISGYGYVAKLLSGNLTLNGNLSYTGGTYIEEGTLILGASTNINSSQEVFFAEWNAPKIDVSSGTATRVFKSFYGEGNPASEIILGGRTLTIGESGQPNGGGVFYGKITGSTGTVTKTGTAELELNNNHTPTGNFNHQEGNVVFGGKWNGKYVKSAAGNLIIWGDVEFKKFDLYGGTISMNLTATPASKITVADANGFYSTGVTNMNLTAPIVTPPAYKILIDCPGGAQSGSLNLTNFTVSPSTCVLGGIAPFDLRLTSNVPDATPPVAGGSGVISGTAYVQSVDLTWTKATDNLTLPANLKYYVYRSLSNNISTPATCTANGTLLNAGGTFDIAAYTATGLTPNTIYYFNVVVEDQAANRTAYVTKSLTTTKATLTGTVTITGSELVTQTLTANTTGLTSTPSATLGSVTVLWRRNGVSTGVVGTTYTLAEADYGQTITAEAATANCLGSVTSAPTGVIGKAALTGTPVITGQAILGLTLTAGTGTLAPAAPVTVLGALSYQWQRNGIDITGATSATYDLEAADVGTTMSVTVTAANCDGSQTSVATLPVAKATLTGAPTITGQAVMGLTLTAGTSALGSSPTIPSIGTLSYQWQRDGVNIGGATSSTYDLVAADLGAVITLIVTAENCDGMATSASTPAVIKATLTGSPTISGSAVFGETLTAVTSALSSSPVIPSIGTLSYQWKRGGVDIPGANFATYDLLEDDLGQTITVIVVADNCEGLATSAPTAAVAKAPQTTAPAAPTMESRTSTSITLDVIAGCEYRIDGGAWQTSPEFTGLDPDTEYSFEARMAETDTHLASPVSAVAKFSTTDGVAIEEVIVPNIVIYPNPCVSTVIVEGADNYLLKITTTEGLVINSEEIISNKQTIQVNELPKGVYLFCLTKDGKMTIKKVIKE